jgi:hypothetical protein
MGTFKIHLMSIREMASCMQKKMPFSNHTHFLAQPPVGSHEGERGGREAAAGGKMSSGSSSQAAAAGEDDAKRPRRWPMEEPAGSRWIVAIGGGRREHDGAAGDDRPQQAADKSALGVAPPHGRMANRFEDQGR